jgi:predicted RNase H-like HicB family nuclease
MRLVFPQLRCNSHGMEIVFSLTQEADGGFVAECLSHDIFTQGDSWEALRANVREAVEGYFFDQPRPSAIRLHLVRDEVLAVA